ncbi:cytochrome b N-terminal domain-containing protein [Bartonella sp. B23]
MDLCRGFVFFIAVYVHLARGLYYGFYKHMREMVWVTGIFIYTIMMAIAFFGYGLIWRMMSVLAALVVASLFKLFLWWRDGCVRHFWVAIA